MDLEEYFENEMDWSGSGLGMVTWSGDGAKIWQREDLYLLHVHHKNERAVARGGKKECGKAPLLLSVPSIFE